MVLSCLYSLNLKYSALKIQKPINPPKLHSVLTINIQRLNYSLGIILLHKDMSEKIIFVGGIYKPTSGIAFKIYSSFTFKLERTLRSLDANLLLNQYQIITCLGKLSLKVNEICV